MRRCLDVSTPEEEDGSKHDQSESQEVSHRGPSGVRKSVYKEALVALLKLGLLATFRQFLCLLNLRGRHVRAQLVSTRQGCLPVIAR